jgi:hypothetical protein
MFRRAAIVLISFWSFSAMADWLVVADTKLGQLRLDKSSLGAEGKYTTAMLLYAFKDLQRLTSPPKAAFNKRQDDVLVDCSNPALGIRTSRFFEDEKLASTYSPDPDKIKLNPAAPDTMALTVVQAVCAASKTKS